MGVNVGDRIKKARIEKGLTQEDLAIAIGNTKAAVSRYELNQRQPRLDQLFEIAKALDVSVEYLLGPYDGPPLPGLVDGDKVDEAEPFCYSPPQARANAAMNQMNEDGQNKVADYAEDILPRYQAQERPQPPAEPREGRDTTPPQEGSERPPEGK